MGLENTTAFLCPTITKPHSRLAILAYFRKMERIWDKDKESAGKSNKKCSSGIHCKCKKSESAFFHVHKCVSVAFSGQKMKGPWFSGIESALVYILPLDGHKWLFWLIRKNTYLQERIINQNRYGLPLKTRRVSWRLFWIKTNNLACQRCKQDWKWLSLDGSATNVQRTKL